MAALPGDIKFTAPFYNSKPGRDKAILEEDEDDDPSRRFSQSSTDVGSLDNKRWPSLVAQEERRKSSEAYKRRYSSSAWSTTSTDLFDPRESDLGLLRRSDAGSRASTTFKIGRSSIGTHDALMNFAPIAAESIRKEEERKVRLRDYPHPDFRLKETLESLKSGYKGSHHWTRRMSSLISRKRLAYQAKDLEDLAKLHFPPRADVRVYVTDFKEHSADLRECKLSEITGYMESKPKDVQIRWIHAPLGLGPVHSTIEDLFRHGGKIGCPFHHAGRRFFPYAVLEVLNFRDRNRFQEMRDVFHFLQGEPKVSEKLNDDCWAGFKTGSQGEESDVLYDLKWRTTHLGLADDWKTLPDFWKACNSDVSWQISEGLMRSNYGPLDGLSPTLWQSDEQALHKHDFFGSAQLVRDLFRCFHREDGMLLTMSPMRGVNYLDRNLKRHLEEPRDAIFDNDVASAIAYIRQQFADSGTQKWHRITVEWLVVHLMTDIGVTPLVDRQGCNAPDLEGAYQELIQQFKRRRNDHFTRKNRHEPAELLQDMLVCKEELRRISLMNQRRKRVFNNLMKDVAVFEREYSEQGKPPDHEDQVSALEKVQTALERAQEESETFETLFDDICMTLSSVYDLRSIQQRQLGAITDSQNKALFLITTVSIVFVPFSTLTGYWGMNLVDIRNSGLDQRNFWHFCASIVISIGSLAVVAALLRYLYEKILSQKTKLDIGEHLVTGPANNRLDRSLV